jgi:hypothetical protein
MNGTRSCSATCQMPLRSNTLFRNRDIMANSRGSRLATCPVQSCSATLSSVAGIVLTPMSVQSRTESWMAGHK